MALILWKHAALARHELPNLEYPAPLSAPNVLVEILLNSYDSFDVEAMQLVPLHKMYWQASVVTAPDAAQRAAIFQRAASRLPDAAFSRTNFWGLRFYRFGTAEFVLIRCPST